jgi:hypothetical protein
MRIVITMKRWFMASKAIRDTGSRKPTARHGPAKSDEEAIQSSASLSSLTEQAQRDPHSLTPGGILQLQRTIGNQSLQRLLTSSPQSTAPVTLTTAPRVQRELSDRDKEVKKKVTDLVKDSKHDEALELICKTYGFTGANFELKVVPAMPTAWATTGGEIKAGAKQTLSIGKDLFSEDFVFILRTIGHEFQHLKQRSQDKPITDQQEREFLSWTWEALDESVPTYELKVAATHAKKALEYYGRMPADTQKNYADKKAQLDKLIEKAK